MSYYDIDEILTDAQVRPSFPTISTSSNPSQKVPCTFQLDVPGLGFLDNNSSSILKSSTRVDLPLWLAQPLALNSPFANSSLITLDLPSSLSPTVIAALKASPKSVDLRAQAAHFYALATRMLLLFEEDEMLGVLYETFLARAVEIGDHAANTGGATRAGGGVGVGTEGVEFLRGLEEDERKLFRAAHDSAKATKAWMNDVKKA